MTPIGTLKRSVSAIVSTFLVLTLGIGIFMPSMAQAFDALLPAQEQQQKPNDGDPDEPAPYADRGIAQQSDFLGSNLDFILKVLNCSLRIIGV